PEWTARDVVQAQLVAEADAVGVAAVLAADADLDVVPAGPAALDPNFHQLADALEVDRLERVARHNVVFDVIADEAAVIVPAHAQAGLGQVVGAEAEELGFAGDLLGGGAGARQLDHRANEEFDRGSLFREDLFGRFADDVSLGLQLGAEVDQ